MSTIGRTTENFEYYFIGLISLLAGIVLIGLSLAGPLVLNIIIYKTSASGLTQTKAQDLVNLILIAPITILGSILHFFKSNKAKYFLSFTAIYIMLYEGLALGIGWEWGNPLYSNIGNNQNYFLAFLILMISGLIIVFAVLSKFSTEDAPEFNMKSVRVFTVIGSVFLIFMAIMWLSEIPEVVSTGNTSSGSYLDSPNLFWLIRFLDLGFTIPLGFISFYLFNTRPKKAYPFLLMFFGFFVSLSSAVNAMGWLMYIEKDPTLQIPGLFIFFVLLAVSVSFYIFLIKPKINLRSIPD
jgi:hypothetical protein